jgi:hypothetical protein
MSTSNYLIEFKTRINQERFWKYYEVKACLVRYAAKDEWKIAFLRVQLLNAERSVHKELPKSKHFRLIHEIHDIGSFDRWLRQLEDYKKVKVGNSFASLDLMRTAPKYHLKMRSYCQQEYDVDQACHVLLRCTPTVECSTSGS